MTQMNLSMKQKQTHRQKIICRDLFNTYFTHWDLCIHITIYGASQVVLAVKNVPANTGDIRDAGSIPGSGRSPGGGHGHSLQYPWLDNSHGQRSLEGYSP